MSALLESEGVAYLALDGDGREVRGTCPAPSVEEAAAVLRGRGLFPVELAPARTPPSAAPRPARSLRPLRATDQILFCRQVALLLRTGHPLLATLEALEGQASHARLARLAGRVRERVRAGRSLSEGLEEERDLPPLVTRLVRTAEATGQLELAFSRAGDHLERSAELRAQVVASLTYPAVVFLVAGGVFWFLALKVVPKLAGFLASRGTALPWTTQTLISGSAFLQAHGVAIGLAIAAAAALLLLTYRDPRGRLAIDGCALRVPVLGPALRAASVARLARTLSLLLQSGVKLLEALRVASEGCGNHAVRAQVEAARERVLAGGTLAEGLEGPALGSLVPRIVGTGEASGALDLTLAELARFSEIELERRLKTLGRLVEPAILILVGGLVGFVYLSFFQALLQLAAR